MSDYKELIEHIQGDVAFRHIISECGADGKVWFDKRFICDYVSRLKYAIEQLVRERDAAVEDLKVNANCTNCKYLNGEGYCVANWCYNGEAWEWRGVQE